jgi:hypothetical protein
VQRAIGKGEARQHGPGWIDIVVAEQVSVRADEYLLYERSAG